MQTAIVVGAGIAGLQAARALLKRGFSVTVLEQNSAVSGVWNENYAGFGLQVPFTCYEFPEFPWPRELLDCEYPSGTAVQQYVAAYAEHFGLLQHVRFHCQLKKVAPCATGGWCVTYHNQESGNPELLVADYVIICTGMYSQPRIPNIKGSEMFKGLQVHAKDFTDVSVAERKRVVVLGAGKSAVDCAAELAVSGRTAGVTWLFRQAHWALPRQVGQLPVESLVGSNLPRLLTPPYYTAGRSKRRAHRLMRPGKSLLWGMIESSIKRELCLHGVLQPALPLQADLLQSAQIVEPSWRELLDVAQSRKSQSSRRQRGFLGGWWGRKGPAPMNSATPGSIRSHADSSSTGSDIAAGEGRLLSPKVLPGSMSPRASFAADLDSGAASSPRASPRVQQLARPEVAVSRAGAGDSPAAAGDSPLGHHPPPSTPNSPSGGPSAGQASRGVAQGAGVAEIGAVSLQSAADDWVGYGAPWAARRELALEQRHGRGRHSHASMDSLATSIRPMLGEIAQFTQQGVLLTDGQHLQVDLMLYCTGYTKNYEYLDGAAKARLGMQKDGLYLYRNMLPPQIPRLAFVGSEVSTFNNILTSGLQAEWLAEHWSGACHLPSPEEMLDDIHRQMEWRRKMVPLQRGRSTVYQLYQQQYHKQLVKDMGLKVPRLRLTQLLQPVTAADYSHVFERQPVQISHTAQLSRHATKMQLHNYSERAQSGELVYRVVSRAPSEIQRAASKLSGTSSITRAASYQLHGDSNKWYGEDMEDLSSSNNLDGDLSPQQGNTDSARTSRAGYRRHSTCSSLAPGSHPNAPATGYRVARPPSVPNLAVLAATNDSLKPESAGESAAASRQGSDGLNGLSVVMESPNANPSNRGVRHPRASMESGLHVTFRSMTTAAAAAAAAPQAAGTPAPGSAANSFKGTGSSSTLATDSATSGSAHCMRSGSLLQKMQLKIQVPGAGAEGDTDAAAAAAGAAQAAAAAAAGGSDGRAALALTTRAPSESALCRRASTTGWAPLAAAAGPAPGAATGQPAAGPIRSNNSRTLMARVGPAAAAPEWAAGGVQHPAAPTSAAPAASAAAVQAGGVVGNGSQLPPGQAQHQLRAGAAPGNAQASKGPNGPGMLAVPGLPGVALGPETSGLLSSPRGATRSTVGSVGPYNVAHAQGWLVIGEHGSPLQLQSPRLRTTSTIGAPVNGQSFAGAPPSVSVTTSSSIWYGNSPGLLNPAGAQAAGPSGGGAEEELPDEMEYEEEEDEEYDEYDPIAPIKALVRQLQERAAMDSEAGMQSPNSFPLGAHTYSAYKAAHLLRAGSPVIARPVSASSVSSRNSMAPTPGQLRLQKEHEQQEYRQKLEQEKTGFKGKVGTPTKQQQEKQQQAAAKTPRGATVPPASPQQQALITQMMLQQFQQPLPPAVSTAPAHQTGSLASPGSPGMSHRQHQLPQQQQQGPQALAQSQQPQQQLRALTVVQSSLYSTTLLPASAQLPSSPAVSAAAAASAAAATAAVAAGLSSKAQPPAEGPKVPSRPTTPGPDTMAAATAAAGGAGGSSGTAAAARSTQAQQSAAGASTAARRASDQVAAMSKKATRSSGGGSSSGSSMGARRRSERRHCKKPQAANEEEQQSDPSVDPQEVQRSKQLVQLWLEQKHEDVDLDDPSNMDPDALVEDMPYSSGSIITVLTGVPSRQHSRARSTQGLQGSSSCHSRDLPFAGVVPPVRVARSTDTPSESHGSPAAVAVVALHHPTGTGDKRSVSSMPRTVVASSEAAISSTADLRLHF